jgi:hypothetical protein
LSTTVRPEKAGVFSRRQSCMGNSQNPLARMAGKRETKCLKPINKAIERMVSESSGRNESECTGGPENNSPGGRILRRGMKATWNSGKMANALEHTGGVIATARGQGHAKQLEKPSLPQTEMAGER